MHNSSLGEIIIRQKKKIWPSVRAIHILKVFCDILKSEIQIIISYQKLMFKLHLNNYFSTLRSVF